MPRVVRSLIFAAGALVAASLGAQSVTETITVTATRTETRIGDTPASVVVVSRDDLKTAAAPATDDVLRQVPGFTLFRRTGSRVANPTTQGVSMRGIGASGASRALVVDDGIPLNDPFGGWVYWGRLERESLDRIEVVRGGASDLYGSSAMGGVVQFIRRRAESSAISADLSGGSQSTGIASVFAAGHRDAWGGSVAADVFRTGGYTLVSPAQRGSVDTNASSSHTAVDATVERGRAFVRGSFYSESRNNGTRIQTNDTTIRQIAAGSDGNLLGGAVKARAWASGQDYAQTFSAIASDRNSERLTAEQRVPSRSAGASLQWARPLTAHNAAVAGIEAKQVSGASNELQYGSAGVTSVDTSGRQRTASGFVENVADFGRTSVTAALRFDSWRNFDAQRNGSPLRDRDESAWSPRIGVLYHATEDLALTASAYRAFRAPTLNELYRGFRVGNVVTLANEDLSAERLEAFEAGARVRNIRATLFWMDMRDVVSNVTLSVTPALITRQRQNLVAIRSRGVELDSDWRIAQSWRASAGYLFSDAVVTAGDLGGKRVPQVPRHQATLQLAWSGRSTVAVQARWSAMQFDDDLNQFRLRGYFVTDALFSYPLAPRLELVAAAENIFNRRIEAGATPVITLGQPRAVRLGLRVGR